MWLQQQQKAQIEQPAQQPRLSRLSLYLSPPEELVSIEEFETLAIDRLKGMP